MIKRISTPQTTPLEPTQNTPPNTYTYEEAIAESTVYFRGQELAAKVWIDKYALRNNKGELLESNPDQMHRRIAKELARIEKGKFIQPYDEEFIYSYLKEFSRIIPQGSMLYGIGNYEQYSTLSNCYVLSTLLDSYGSIHQTDEEISQISKRRGGCGLDISNIRPATLPTKNSSRTTTGIIPFAERFSNSIREVGQNGRRGALMITCSVHHPQILDFVSAKTDLTKITGANISVKLTDEFLNAVTHNKTYEQRWQSIDGKSSICKITDAQDVWKKIIHSAWLTAEPGLLFWDNIIKESPADCYARFGFRTISTNPCSELPLSALDSCRLLLQNLLAYIKEPFTDTASFDFNAFYEDAQIAQRLMDDIIDLELEHIKRIIDKINADPEPYEVKCRELNMWQKIYDNCETGRRTGLGVTAVGDAIAALGIKYGSEESIELVDKIYKTLKLGAYRSSVDMARELGHFKVWDYELEKDNPFLLRIKDEDPSLYEDMKKYGRRNIAILTTAPAGSMSLIAQSFDSFGTSSGIEPVFQLEYRRRKKINPSDTYAKVDFTDANGDSWHEFTVFHPTVIKWMNVSNQTDTKKSPWYKACANDIDWVNRVKLQAAAQKHIDHAISSTINLPSDVTEEKVAEIYETAWKTGLKGITVYRDGCRDGVLINKDATHVNTTSEERPKEIICDVHHVSVKGKEYFVLVGLINGVPYEVFAGRNGFLKKKIKHGKVVKVKKGLYKAIFEDGTELVPISAASDESEESITRLTSAALRSGCDMHYIVDQLEKINGDMYGFTRSISRALKKYIPDGTKVAGAICPECHAESIIREEGCKKCASCGYSKCH